MSRVRDTRPRHRENNGLDLDRDPVAMNRFRLPPSVMAKTRYSCRPEARLRLWANHVVYLVYIACLSYSRTELFASRRQTASHAPSIIVCRTSRALARSLKIFVTTACKHSACSPDYRFRDDEPRGDTHDRKHDGGIVGSRCLKRVSFFCAVEVFFFFYKVEWVRVIKVLSKKKNWRRLKLKLLELSIVYFNRSGFFAQIGEKVYPVRRRNRDTPDYLFP